MSYAIEEVARVVRRESARKKRIVANLGALGFSMDGQMSEMSSAELARHALKSLGLKIGNDPVEALDFYLAGLQLRGTERTRAWAADATEPSGGESFIDRYLKE